MDMHLMTDSLCTFKELKVGAGHFIYNKTKYFRLRLSYEVC